MCVRTGAVIYLLDLFCNATHPDVRNKTAELLAKMLADKLVGPKVSVWVTGHTGSAWVTGHKGVTRDYLFLTICSDEMTVKAVNL